MSEGTPIDAIENGDVADAADTQHMQAILADMNASGADIANGPGIPQAQQPMPPMRGGGMPPMYNPMPPAPQQRQYVDDGPIAVPHKKTTSSVLERIVDPLVVAVILFILSLPVLHTYAARYVSWGFAIGGQLSWLGLIALSLVGGALFGIYRTGRDILGL
jgi:hypothetical protein